MILNLRTQISLSQLLDIFEYQWINILFEKYSLSNNCQNIGLNEKFGLLKHS
jgi:hypothetical protein